MYFQHILLHFLQTIIFDKNLHPEGGHSISTYAQNLFYPPPPPVRILYRKNGTFYKERTLWRDLPLGVYVLYECPQEYFIFEQAFSKICGGCDTRIMHIIIVFFCYHIMFPNHKICDNKKNIMIWIYPERLI